MSGNKDRDRGTLDSMSHRHFQSWATGDGATVEFALPHSILRADDLKVYVAGVVKRPAASGTAFDYKIRGLTPGYPGDSNRVKFTAAPALNANILFYTAGG